MTTLAQGFKVLAAGVLTQVQDLGRFGQAALGLTTSGPADKGAFDWANRLLQNQPNAAALEIAMGGLKLQSLCDTVVCYTGADMAMSINSKAVAHWQTHKIRCGDVIEFGYAARGIRGYLAFAGGLPIAESFGSRATTIREGIGGLAGGKLQAGDVIPLLKGQERTEQVKLAPECWPSYRNEILLRLVLGYQYQEFSNIALTRFFSSEYQVSSQFDRMGYRLTGPEVTSEVSSMLSEGISLGAVQVPPDGQPIVLLQDRQTIGGYPKLGSVLSLDLAKLTQCGQGAKVRFQAISIDEAHNAQHLAKAKYQRTQVQCQPW